MATNDLIGDVRAMVAAGRKNKRLPKAFPALDRLDKAVGALDAAQIAAQSRAVGTVPARNAARKRVFQAAAGYKSAVEQVANTDPANGTVIIVESGLRMRRESTRRKAQLSAKPARLSRSLIADVRSVAKRASYEWQISLDGGETWIKVKTTLETRTLIEDLPLAKSVKIRVRPITKSGPGNWIGPITVLVT